MTDDAPIPSCPREALKLACERAGGQAPLAGRIGTTQSQVWYWLTKSKKGVPAEFDRVPERGVTGGGTPRSPARAGLVSWR
ncbi:YdaS family helix-turn-helix protein [Bradyrhizobium sp. ORS 86]|uniref:YdaS family helix-turn-helix protein n=1 Tax=Bradyrhizobium sp. ORS 86 TaxID=1685970 RepID=UPI00388D770B